jgi:glycosyltransferase involved in cell wall biosynthesis
MIKKDNLNTTTNKPLVSIGIPTYNHPESLRRTLDSITSQTYNNLEIIVSDNCSPGPETEIVVREFIMRDDRIRYYRQDSNIGALSNFKFVFEKATGKYFMWVADDDEWDLNSVNTFVRELERNPEVSVVMSACKQVNEDGQLYDIVHNFHSRVDPNLMNPVKLTLDASTNHLWTQLFYGLFRTDYLKKFDITPDVFGSDVLFTCHVLMSTKIRYIDDVLYIRMVHENGTAKRYANEKIGKQYADLLKYYKMIFSLGPYLLRSNLIPIKNKLWVPFIVLYMTIFQIMFDIKFMIYRVYLKFRSVKIID